MRLATQEKISQIIRESDGNTSMLSEKLQKEYGVVPAGLDNDGDSREIAEKINRRLGADEVVLRMMLEEILKEHPDREFIQFDGKQFSCREMLDEVKRIAAGFLEKGIRKGSRAAIILDNCIEYIYSYFALFYIGALPVPINIRWKKNELYNILENADVSCIICAKKAGTLPYGDYIREYVKDRDSVRQVFYTDENLYGEKGMAFSQLKACDPVVPEKLEEIAPDDIVMISYTSGTTGMPKGVLLKNNDVYKISKYSAEYWCGDRQDKPFSIAPLYSAQGFLSLLINVATECPFKMISSFNPNDIMKEISKRENTIIHTQPTMWNLLLNCRIIDFARFDALKTLVVSGSLCTPALAERVEKRMGCRLMNAYGLIEGTSVVTMTRLDDPEEIRLNTVGRPIDGVEIRIVDQNRKNLRKGEIGELAVRGYNMAGYYRNEEKTREVLDEDGWLYTGDLAKFYDEENISIVGRCKDMIIRGGFNVYPSDIEECIMQMENIQNVAVVGRDHEILGEEIWAFIVPKAGIRVTDRDVTRFLFEKLSNYKMPDKVVFISEMPIILAGKVDKKVLEDWARHGIPDDKQVLFENQNEQ